MPKYDCLFCGRSLKSPLNDIVMQPDETPNSSVKMIETVSQTSTLFLPLLYDQLELTLINTDLPSIMSSESALMMKLIV